MPASYRDPHAGDDVGTWRSKISEADRVPAVSTPKPDPCEITFLLEFSRKTLA